MSIELQSPMKALFRMYKPITVVLTSAISILCVQQKAIADDHVRIDKPAHETSDVLCVEYSVYSFIRGDWDIGYTDCWSSVKITSDNSLSASVLSDGWGFKDIYCEDVSEIELHLCNYVYKKHSKELPSSADNTSSINSEILPEDETYGEFTNDSNYTTEYSEGEISQGHNRCLQAADYKGCMEYQEGSNTRITETGSEPGTVDVTEPKPYNYDPESVVQLKIRGSYGRYLTFIGKTVNEYAGTSGYMLPGSPGSVSCNTYGGYGAYSSTYTTCNRSGYVAPTYVPGTSGGVQNRKYRYELDCQDMTFDRKGDYAGGMSNKGWMSVYNDPTAQAVANRYCSSIGSLPRAAER